MNSIVNQPYFYWKKKRMKKRTDFRSYRFEKRKKHSDNGNTRWSFGPQNLWSQRVQGRKGGGGKGKLRVQTWCADMTLGDQGHWKWDQGRLSCWTNHSRRMTGVEVRSKTISLSTGEETEVRDNEEHSQGHIVILALRLGFEASST